MKIPEFEIRDLVPLSTAAEATVSSGMYMGRPVVVKLRRKKGYRLPSLDKMINKQRTSIEVKVLHRAYTAGLPVPQVLLVNPSENMIVMERVAGTPLKNTVDDGHFLRRMEELGNLIARLHKLNIIHGDLTTSNVILSDRGLLYLIDFGLAKFTPAMEDKGVDILVLKRTLFSTHAAIADAAWESFLRGYLSSSPEDEEKVLKKLESIEKRGRYSGH